MAASTPGRSTVALVTCAEYRQGHVDDVAAVPLLADLGVEARFAVWDDPDVDWAAFDLAILRSTWDYPPRRDEFLAWAAAVPNLANPIDAVRWSSDKRYLGELMTAGAPCVPTTFVEAGAADAEVDEAIHGIASSTARFVVKPSVGAGSVDAGRFESADAFSVEQAVKHTRALVESGRSAMVQPYLDGVDVTGETAVVFLGGAFSHAIRKEPILLGGLTDVEGLFVEEQTAPVTPTQAEVAAAEAVLAAAPVGADDLLYARVDLLPGPDDSPLLLELELVEPSLFLADAPGAAARFADVVARRCRG